MKNDRRQRLLQLLADIDQQIADVERLMVEPTDDETLVGSSKLPSELRESLSGVERQILREEELDRLRESDN